MIFNPTPEHLVEARNWMFQACFIWSIWGGVGLAYYSECGAKFKISFCWGYLLCLASAVTWVYLMHEIPVENFSQDIQILLILGAFPLVNSIYAHLLGRLNRPNFQLKSKMAGVGVPFHLLFWMIASPIAFPVCICQLMTGSLVEAEESKRRIQQFAARISRIKNKSYRGDADYESYRDLDGAEYEAECDAYRAWADYYYYYWYYQLPYVDDYYDNY